MTSRYLFPLLSALFLLAPAPCRPQTAAAQVTAERGTAGELLLTGPDCASLAAQAWALTAWAAALGETPGSAGLCACSGTSCSLEVAAAAPAFAASMHGVKAGRWGPNCWNAALTANGLLAAPRFTSPDEMTFWTASPACRALAADEEPRPGDVIAIREASGEEVHGFVYLTPELSFSKNYLTAAAPYALQPPEAVYAEFPVKESCRRPGAGPACARRSDYFRCRRAAVPAAPADPVYAAAEASAAAAEKALSELALRWKTDPELRARAPEILAAAGESLRLARAAALGRGGFHWRALLLRTESLLHQVSLI